MPNADTPAARMRMAAHVVAFALLAGSTLQVIAQQAPLPQGTLEAKPRSNEVETKQVGGNGQAAYLFVGTLRCKTATQGIVGARMLRSDVVDLLQIGCSSADCTDEMTCEWKQLDRSAGAGKPNENSRSSIAVCAHDMVISGYRARFRLAGNGPVDYVSDLQFECARVIASALPGQKGAPDSSGLPVSDTQRMWMPFPPPDDATSPPAPADAPWPVEDHCRQRAATGVSVAVGTYKPTGQQVIQALSLFCARAPVLNGATTGE